MSRSYFLIMITAGIMSAGGHASAAEDVTELIQDGIRLKNERHYSQAVERFRTAVEADGRSGEALLQLAGAYAEMAEYNKCVSTARRGLKLDSAMNASFYGVLGRCYAGDGHVAKAHKTYDKGLQLYPEDVSLNYATAVLLAEEQENQDAITYLKKVVQYDPEYAPAYFLLGRLLAGERCYAPAIYSHMRFVALEPNTRDSVQAAKQIFEMLRLGVDSTATGSADVATYPNPPAIEADLSALESSRLRAAAANYGEAQQAVGEPRLSVGALQSFVQMSAELGDEQLATSFTWRYLADASVTIYQEELFEPFAYLLAARAGIDGALDWLKENPHRLRKLNSFISQ